MMRKAAVPLLSLLALMVFSSPAPGVFTRVTEDALGIPHDQVPGWDMGAWPDYNNDGWPDLHIGAHFLFVNNRDGTFTRVGDIGLEDIPGAPYHVYRSAWADQDNDGDLDCVQGNHGRSTEANPLYSYYYDNSGPPDFTFTRQAIYRHPHNTRAGQPAFVDGDGDGDLEIYLATFGNWSPDYGIDADRYFIRLEDGTWVERTDYHIPELATWLYYRHVRGVNVCDYDNDFDQDIFVPVYPIAYSDPSFANCLWENSGDGDFADVAGYAGVAIEPHGRYVEGIPYQGYASGASWGDYDNDGWFDLVVGNIHGIAALYRNNRDGTFEMVTFESGLPGTSPEKQWHNTLWFDYDNDGDLDLFLCQWYEYRAYIFRNDGPENIGYFTDVTSELGFDYSSEFKQLNFAAAADYDRDGDLDLFFSGGMNDMQGKHLCRNDLDDESSGNHWMVISLAGDPESSGTTALGARVRIRFADGWSGAQLVESTSADQAMNMHPVHFGLAERDSIAEIVVWWPDGYVESFDWEAIGEAVDQWITLEQWSGEEYEELNSPEEHRRPAVPVEPRLHQPAPNPFNSATSVQVTIPAKETVHLQVHDIQGRMVASLFEGELEAGTHRFRFTGEHLASGVYILSLQTPGTVQTRKMVLIR